MTNDKWCRRGESNLVPPLTPRKLLILRTARNCQNATNAADGYVTGTQPL
jgi:hypothetical protein